MNKTGKYWFFLLMVVVLFVCSWTTIGVIHIVRQPPQSAEDRAKAAFIRSCSYSQYGNRFGVPDVSSKPWTCVIPKGPQP